MLPGEAPEEPLAEFWLGGHPKGCSSVQLPDGTWTSLADLPRKHPSLLGTQRHPQALPFMLKVLSVDPSWGLSIQAHPDLELAHKLHILDPINYPDASHKPEVGVPLSPVSLLYGFRDESSMRDVLSRFPEIKSLLGEKLAGEAERKGGEPAVRRAVLAALLESPRAVVEQTVLSIAARFRDEESIPREVEILDRLRPRYGNGDVGLLAIFVLNVVDVLPGSAVYIGPNVPHAYLEGDLVECMACSDNVVRAGLTPKFKDVSTLISMLDYSCGRPEAIPVQPVGGGFAELPIPATEFSLRILPHGSAPAQFVPEEGQPEVLLCLGRSVKVTSQRSGDGLSLKDGEAALIPAGTGPCAIERSEAAVFRAAAGKLAALKGAP